MISIIDGLTSFFEWLLITSLKSTVVAAIIIIVQIIHWFNPVIWYTFNRVRLDRELACDEMSLSAIGE